MDFFGRSAAAGSTDRLLAHASFSAGDGALNLDRGAVDLVSSAGVPANVSKILPTPASAPAVEAVIDRREGSIHRRTVLPTETGAQDMNSPIDDPPIVMSAGAGVDPGKKRRNRAAQASSSSSSHPAHSFYPSGQSGRLNQKILAIPSG
jgi:hypothetical protein